jgi:hypothetical protein
MPTTLAITGTLGEESNVTIEATTLIYLEN